MPSQAQQEAGQGWEYIKCLEPQCLASFQRAPRGKRQRCETCQKKRHRGQKTKSRKKIEEARQDEANAKAQALESLREQLRVATAQLQSQAEKAKIEEARQDEAIFPTHTSHKGLAATKSQYMTITLIPNYSPLIPSYSHQPSC
eukprot:SAG31_NODE_8389_length_1460_cov_1.828068_2_plen_144_part_00